MYFVQETTPVQARDSVLHTCPNCGAKALFRVIGYDLRIDPISISAQRACPNCRCHVFIVFQRGTIVAAYPPLKIDFDTTDIPAPIVKTFSEALDCHSHNGLISAAIMVRRTLEEVCADRKASGKDLKDRIRDLKSKVILPPELFDAMDELRLLGNDAAHLEAKSYEEIGTEELMAAIQFTKEILKGLYQYKGLLSKLQSLKKNATAKGASPSGAKAAE